jgi:hypothetical protein
MCQLSPSPVATAQPVRTFCKLPWGRHSCPGICDLAAQHRPHMAARDHRPAWSWQDGPGFEVKSQTLEAVAHRALDAGCAAQDLHHDALPVRQKLSTQRSDTYTCRLLPAAFKPYKPTIGQQTCPSKLQGQCGPRQLPQG